jgi:hypothetical protein
VVVGVAGVVVRVAGLVVGVAGVARLPRQPTVVVGVPTVAVVVGVAERPTCK